MNIMYEPLEKRLRQNIFLHLTSFLNLLFHKLFTVLHSDNHFISMCFFKLNLLLSQPRIEGLWIRMLWLVQVFLEAGIRIQIISTKIRAISTRICKPTVFSNSIISFLCYSEEKKTEFNTYMFYQFFFFQIK